MCDRFLFQKALWMLRLKLEKKHLTIFIFSLMNALALGTLCQHIDQVQGIRLMAILSWGEKGSVHISVLCNH